LWDKEHKSWCCKYQDVGCGFDCDVNYTHWQANWTAEKAEYCCMTEGRGCGGHNCTAGLKNWKAGWADTKKDWCCKYQDLACRYDCQKDSDDWEKKWDLGQQFFCCDIAGKGCGTFNCSAGVSDWKDGWTKPKKSWCCEHQDVGCEYDCAANTSTWEKDWSQKQKEFCCAERNFGCPKATLFGKDVDQTKLLAMLNAIVKGAISKLFSRQPSLQDDMEENTNDCQWSCMEKNAPLAFETLLGIGKASKSIVSESVTGALKACYPLVSRGHLQMIGSTIAGEVEKSLDKDATPPRKPMKLKLKKCPGQPATADEVLTKKFNDTFKKHFFPSMGRVMSSSEVGREIIESGKDCQHSCVDSALANTLQNLWSAGLFGRGQGDEVSTQAITGAFKMCFPGVNRDSLLTIVAETFGAVRDLVDEAEVADTSTDATVDLYTLGSISSAVLSAPGRFPMWSLGAVAVAGGVLGWRMRRSGMVVAKPALADFESQE